MYLFISEIEYPVCNRYCTEPEQKTDNLRMVFLFYRSSLSNMERTSKTIKNVTRLRKTHKNGIEGGYSTKEDIAIPPEYRGGPE